MSTVESTSERLGPFSEAGSFRLDAISRGLRRVYDRLSESWYAGEAISREVRPFRDEHAGQIQPGRPPV